MGGGKTSDSLPTTHMRSSASLLALIGSAGAAGSGNFNGRRCGNAPARISPITGGTEIASWKNMMASSMHAIPGRFPRELGCSEDRESRPESPR